MISVLPYERTARPSPKNQPRSNGAYLKDYDSTQEFGSSKKRVDIFQRFVRLHISSPPWCDKTRSWRVLVCFVSGAVGKANPKVGR